MKYFAVIILFTLYTIYQIPNTVYAQTEESILNNYQTGTLPNEAIIEAKQQEPEFTKKYNLLQSTLRSVLGYFGSLQEYVSGKFGFEIDPQKAPLYSSKGFSQAKSQVPENIIPEPTRSQDIVKDTVQYIGEDKGVFSNTCPTEVNSASDKIKGDQYNCYGQGYFPTEYNPFPKP